MCSWYAESLQKLKVANERFYYDLTGFFEKQKPKYESYAITESKTFDTLFSHELKQLQGVVDDSQYKRARYAVAGFPYKLDILLHGPAGTGKTSAIKAIAHHLDRHVVNTPLARIVTNMDLKSVFFNKLYGYIELPFKDVIFVLEDLDATSDFVKPRDLKYSRKRKPLHPRRKRIKGFVPRML